MEKIGVIFILGEKNMVKGIQWFEEGTIKTFEENVLSLAKEIGKPYMKQINESGYSLKVDIYCRKKHSHFGDEYVSYLRFQVLKDNKLVDYEEGSLLDAIPLTCTLGLFKKHANFVDIAYVDKEIHRIMEHYIKSLQELSHDNLVISS